MKIKFNLGWILAITTALVLAVMGFMSFYYLNGGKPMWGIIVAVCILVIPIIVCMQLVKAKECSKPFYFHRAAVTELTMLIVILVVLVGVMAATNHFYTVNSRADEIEKIRIDQRTQRNEMTTHYNSYVKERENTYGTLLKALAINKTANEQLYYEVFPNGAGANNDDIDNVKVKGLHERIAFIANTKGDILEKEQIRWWTLPSVMNDVDVLSNALEKRYDTLVQRSHNDTVSIPLIHKIQQTLKRNDMPEIGYWDYPYTPAEQVMAKFTESEGFISNIWTVISGLVGLLLVMLPYFVAERDNRSKGLWKELCKKEDENEGLIGNGNIGTV